MVTSALTEVKGLVDPRFLLTAFFPVLVFLLALLWLAAAAQGAVGTWVAAVDTWSASTQLLVSVAVVALAFVLAQFVSSNTLYLVQLYSGRIAPRWLREWGTERQEARLAREARRRSRRPGAAASDPRGRPAHTVLPTRLGTVWAAGEEYPRDVYGTEAGTTWPRLLLLLPPDVHAAVHRPSDTCSSLLLGSALLTVLALVGGVVTAVAGLGPVLYVAVLLGGLALARLAYRGAVAAAEDFQLNVRAAYDLYRNDLLTRLGLPLPATRAEEVRTWTGLEQVLAAERRRPVAYVRGDADA